MNSCGKLMGLLCSTGLATTAAADAVFNIWIEAPKQVEAGESFNVSVWAEVSGSVLIEGEGAMHSFWTDMIATGIGAEFSPADVQFFCARLSGTPEIGALSGVGGSQNYYSPGCQFWTSNPQLLFETVVTPIVGTSGLMELSVQPVAGQDSMIDWWVDYMDSISVADTDPGSSRNITPATVRVVPSSGGVTVFAVAGLGIVRRRR